MNIFFFTLSKIQNIKDKGIYSDMVNEFISRGHKVDYFFPLDKSESIKGLNFSLNSIKIDFKIQKTLNFLKKIYSYYLLDKKVSTILRKSKIKYDLLLISTPSIFQIRIVSTFKRKFRNSKVILLLKDIFPDNAVDLDILKKSIFYSFAFQFFKNIEIRLYSLVNFIGVMTELNKQYLIQKHPSIKNKVFISPNSINPYSIKSNIIRDHIGLPLNKTIISFVGNIGLPQNPFFLINLINNSPQHIHFLIVGSGTHYNLFKEISKEKLTLINHNLTQDKIDQYLTNSDYGLISLSSNFNVPNFPSKILSYLNANLPIIAFTNDFNDLRYLINEKRIIGYWQNSGNLNACISILINLDAKSEKKEHPVFRLYNVKHQVSKIINLLQN